MKTPPDRSGITFEVGAQLEARDRQKNWYAATIEKIDYDKERVLVHYRQWSRRHNEWFHWSSPYLRPLERVSLRRQGLNAQQSPPVFVSGSKVLACWTDCRFYPAKILKVNKDESYTVRFYDGVVQTVKPTKIKPFQERSRSEKSAVGSEGWEEGESEEEEQNPKGEEGEEQQQEEEEEEKGEEETSEEKEGAEEEEDEEERTAEPSSSHSPAKKKTENNRSDGVQKQPITADSNMAAVPNPAHIDKDVLMERQAHLPTTHKFSREPLYRVIKNQPPPILSIELDHNPFKCPAPGCSKSFRKASLLHYHIKYYHSDQQLDAGAEPEASRRKRSASEGGDFPSSKKAEILTGGCRRDDREQSIMGTGGSELGRSPTDDRSAKGVSSSFLFPELKKEERKEKLGGHDRKDRKHFLRVKLRKKKKKKKKKRSQSAGFGSSDDETPDRPPLTLKLAHSQVDDGSDWSTLTAESGEDTPWPLAMETDDCEVVRCVCEVDEENDFMIQCESCLCWQHGTCMGLYEDNVPHNYICYYCRQTSGWRRAQRFLSEPDLLLSGHMFGLSCVKENYSEVNASKISHTSHLLAQTHALHQVLSGLQLKISLLHSPSHPDLQLWRSSWRQEEAMKLTSGQKDEPPVCYVSSEHCYQKPEASWETAEEMLMMVDAGEKEAKPEDLRTPASLSTMTPSDSHIILSIKPENDADEEEVDLRPASASVAQCRLNLLEHVESLHHQISARMDLIERELDVLESWLDHSGELEPPDPLSRLPQLKQRIRRLLSDLCTVRRLAVCR
ncbi:PHD finger protein 20 isoform X1 [Fundulus heteroclitus]|uniref:PHD finger protein 20 isoform X1 n=1 Tax=Fundulus heteroclitus TaxID=8078 RepID=UPI00165A7185|nr:PHD finger protein 20 isoform X1 [Fundulus heteroclitus]XP_035998871.1 PHD finger protein 20 isoform X1 [Fundulus heteroclitus]